MADVTLVTGDDGSNIRVGTPGDDLIYGYDPNGPQSVVGSITATRVASGLSQPLFAGTPPGDLSRLFIVEKTGLINILDLASGQILPTPFLDVSAEISTAGECGLLGLAFDPNFATNGRFYVNLVSQNLDTEIRRYQVSTSDPNRAEPASATLVISVDQPDLSNHKAGWLGFGRDGSLYVALGDGGGGGDPFGNGQNIDVLLGKMLRLDVNSDAFPSDPNRNYAIPADNPFVGTTGLNEIWALGLRNPFRDSFDRGLGTLFIADVGQGVWEEINIGQKGANYGWNVFEGPATFAGGTPTGGSAVPPIYFYDHSVGVSIIGGYVYRGTSEGLQGDYFFADLNGKVFTLHFNGTSWSATERTPQIAPNVGGINTPVSFGEDGFGNLYIVDLDGEVFRLTPNVTSADAGDDLSGGAGNDMIFAGSGKDLVRGGTGNDTLYGGNGNDMLSGDPGNDFIFGGDGIDVASFSGMRANYQIRALSNGVFQVIDLRPGSIDGIDTLSNTEFLQFSDQTVTLPPQVAGPKPAAFAPSQWTLSAFGAGGMAGGWSSNDVFPRTLADVNGDGMADVVGFGAWGVNVALATGGGHFAQPTLELVAFAIGEAGGWSSDDVFPRTLADVNGDGTADVVGFGAWGVNVALATGGGHFAQPTLTLNAFGADGSAGGWTSNNVSPRMAADANGDGLADIAGFNNLGVNIALAYDTLVF
jgi:glucose/arabinose dehydrogenase